MTEGEQAAELTRTNEALQAEIKERKRAEQVSRGQTEAMVKALDVLAAEPTLDAFLSHVLCAIATQLSVKMCALYLYEPDSQTLSLHMTYHEGRVIHGTEQLGHPSANRSFPAGLNRFWQVLVESRQPLVIPDIENSPLLEHHHWLSANGIRSLLIVPLLLGTQVIGCLGIRSKEFRDYAPEEIELAQALAHQITLAINTTRLAEQGRRNAVLEERNRMAREIHDTLAQGFAGIAVQLEAMKRTLPPDADPLRQQISMIRTLALDCLEQARRSIWALRPQPLEGSRLKDALAKLAARLTTGDAPHIHVQVHGKPFDMPPNIEEQFYWIAQEAAANAMKYAHAQNVWVEVHRDADTLRLAVSDDGCGFSLSDTTQPTFSGFGLTAMQERAAQMGGQFTLVSEPGRGTQITVVVSLPEHIGDTPHA